MILESAHFGPNIEQIFPKKALKAQRTIGLPCAELDMNTIK